MITYQVEQWRIVAPEMVDLWQAHWEEIALNRDTIKLAVDHKSYESFADAGALHVVTAREAGGIIGYHISIVRPHLHYVNDLHGFTDVYYLAPEYRQGWTAIKLFKTVERTLKARGVVKIFTGTKLSLDMGRLFERLGFHETERLYTKVLNDQVIHQPHVPRVQARPGAECSSSNHRRCSRRRGRKFDDSVQRKRPSSVASRQR